MEAVAGGEKVNNSKEKRVESGAHERQTNVRRAPEYSTLGFNISYSMWLVVSMYPARQGLCLYILEMKFKS